MRIPCFLSTSAACFISSLETAISELPSLESKLFELMEAGADADEAPPAYVAMLLDALLEELSVKDAARIAARATNLPKADLYRMALERRTRDA